MSVSLRFSLMAFLLSAAATAQSMDPSPGISELVVRDSIVYVGTYTSGVAKSTDHGQTWQPASNGLLSKEIWSLAESKGYLFAGTPHGVYRSTDAGLSWSLSNSGLTDFNLYSLFAQDSIVLAGAAVALFRSTDLGLTWTPSASALGTGGAYASRMVWYDSAIVAAANGVFRSTDGGVQWTPIYGLAPSDMFVLDPALYVSSGLGVSVTSDGGSTWTRHEFGPSINTFAAYSVAATNSHIFAGTSGDGVLVSNDSGATWAFSNAGLSNPFVYVMGAVDSVVFAGTPAGLFRSFDQGSTWEKVILGTGLGKVQGFLVVGSTAFAATAGGVVRSTDSTTWVPVDSGLTFTDVSALAALDSTIFATTRGGGLFRSTDLGDHWHPFGSGLTDATLESMTTFDSLLFIGTNSAGVFVSSDSGATWTPSGTLPLGGRRVMTFLVKDDSIYVGTDWAVYASSDTGATWTERSSGIDLGYIMGLASQEPYIFAASGFGGGVYRSSDDGVSWTAVNNGLSNQFVNTLTAGGGSLFAGTSWGLYVSTDLGSSWTSFDSSVAEEKILAVHVAGEEVLIGTTSRIVRRALSAGTVGVEGPAPDVPGAFHLSQPYPNPFNPATTIGFRLPSTGHYQLAVFDLLGRQVALLVDAWLPAGDHRVEWNAGSHSSGVYLVRLSAGSSVQIVKALLVR